MRSLRSLIHVANQPEEVVPVVCDDDQRLLEDPLEELRVLQARPAMMGDSGTHRSRSANVVRSAG
jgi:hypothetical protein